MNAVFQALVEPIFRFFNFKSKKIAFLFFFSTLLILPIYYYMPLMTNLFFPSYSNDLFEVFRLLSILLLLLFISKVATYFFLGRVSILKMNKFNIQFLFIEIFLVFCWYFFMELEVEGVILLLCMLNVVKVFLIALVKFFPKISTLLKLDD